MLLRYVKNPPGRLCDRSRVEVEHQNPAGSTRRTENGDEPVDILRGVACQRNAVRGTADLEISFLHLMLRANP